MSPTMSESVRGEPRDKQVEPTVVIIVPDQQEKLSAGSVTPSSSATSVNVPLPLLRYEPIRSQHVRDVQIEITVVVVVSPGRALGEGRVRHPGLVGNVLKGPIAKVVVQPAIVERAGDLADVVLHPATYTSSRPSL